LELACDDVCVLPTVNTSPDIIGLVEKQNAAGQRFDESTPRARVSAATRLRILAAGVAIAGIVTGVIAASGTSTAPASSSRLASERVTSASPAVFRRALMAKLRSEHADFQWVVCLRNGRRFDGVPVVRCNVEFGEPHVEAYCSVFRGGHLLTSQDLPAIPCSPDDVGFSAPIHTYR
jgi:hypothetical protein